MVQVNFWVNITVLE